MKYLRSISLILALLLCFSVAGCGNDDSEPRKSKTEEKTTSAEIPAEPPVTVKFPSASEESTAESTIESTAESTTEIQESASTTESTTEAPEPEEELRWDALYTSVLSAFRAEQPQGSYFSEFSLYDLNGDQIPELFVKSGTCEADSMYSVFTVANGAAQSIGTLSGSHSTLCGLFGQNACLLQNAIQGYEAIEKVTMAGNTLHTETIYSGTPKEYHELSPMPSYSYDTPPVWNGNPWDSNQSILDNFSGGLPYLFNIPFADQSVFSGPSYDDFFVQTVQTAGTYTIVEEQWDWEGNLWGKLKSGVGWVDLTEVESRIQAQAPISANYTDSLLLSSGNYHHFSIIDSEYCISVAFRAYKTLYEVRLYDANLASENGLELFPLRAIDQLTPDKPFVAELYFPGDMSAYAIAFKDENGKEYLYVLTTNGRNNALSFYEY